MFKTTVYSETDWNADFTNESKWQRSDCSTGVELQVILGFVYFNSLAKKHWIGVDIFLAVIKSFNKKIWRLRYHFLHLCV